VPHGFLLSVSPSLPANWKCLSHPALCTFSPNEIRVDISKGYKGTGDGAGEQLSMGMGARDSPGLGSAQGQVAGGLLLGFRPPSLLQTDGKRPPCTGGVPSPAPRLFAPGKCTRPILGRCSGVPAAGWGWGHGLGWRWSPAHPWQGEVVEPSNHRILMLLLISAFPEMGFLHFSLCPPGFLVRK